MVKHRNLMNFDTADNTDALIENIATIAYHNDKKFYAALPGAKLSADDAKDSGATTPVKTFNQFLENYTTLYDKELGEISRDKSLNQTRAMLEGARKAQVKSYTEALFDEKAPLDLPTMLHDQKVFMGKEAYEEQVKTYFSRNGVDYLLKTSLGAAPYTYGGAQYDRDALKELTGLDIATHVEALTLQGAVRKLQSAGNLNADELTESIKIMRQIDPGTKIDLLMKRFEVWKKIQMSSTIIKFPDMAKIKDADIPDAVRELSNIANEFRRKKTLSKDEEKYFKIYQQMLLFRASK
jgi:hypothetical protein